MTPKPEDIRVLAVDDSEEDCKLHEMILLEAGFQIDTASTARRARALMEENEYGVLLLDLQMPDANGLDLLASARERDAHATAVVLTGHESTKAAVAALKAGAYDFLTKPCSPELLVSAVRRAGEKNALLKALAARTEELEDLNRMLDRRVRDATQEIFSLNEKLKRYVADLVATNNDQTRALEEMAHELKNPLAVIWGYTSFLLRTPLKDFEPEEAEKALRNIQKNARHLQELIEELLDSARITSRKIELEKKRLPVLKILEDTLDGVHLLAEESSIALDAECEENLEVTADPMRLKQILTNLLTNAVKFTPADGQVTLSARRSEDDGVLFTVADTGKGMDADQAKRIFERFYQVKERGTKNQGLGLGLSIAEGLVKLHKGRIWVESEPGAGSKFFVFIPEDRVVSTLAASN